MEKTNKELFEKIVKLLNQEVLFSMLLQFMVG
jgi:hypothetical protein